MNPASANLIKKNIDRLNIISGIRNFRPSFSSPLLTNPRTKDAKMSVEIMNRIEK